MEAERCCCHGVRFETRRCVKNAFMLAGALLCIPLGKAYSAPPELLAVYGRGMGVEFRACSGRVMEKRNTETRDRKTWKEGKKKKGGDGMKFREGVYVIDCRGIDAIGPCLKCITFMCPQRKDPSTSWRLCPWCPWLTSNT